MVDSWKRYRHTTVLNALRSWAPAAPQHNTVDISRVAQFPTTRAQSSQQQCHVCHGKRMRHARSSHCRQQ